MYLIKPTHYTYPEMWIATVNSLLFYINPLCASDPLIYNVIFNKSTVKRLTAVTAYYSTEQLLLFGFEEIFSQPSYPIPRHWYVPIDALLKVYTIEESNNIFVTKPRSERSDKYVFWWIIMHSGCFFYHNIWWMSRCAVTDPDRHLFYIATSKEVIWR